MPAVKFMWRVTSRTTIMTRIKRLDQLFKSARWRSFCLYNHGTESPNGENHTRFREVSWSRCYLPLHQLLHQDTKMRAGSPKNAQCANRLFRGIVYLSGR
jgi:hypothetical protein